MLHETHEARPVESLTRVPYWVFQTAETYRTEQERIFQGPSWHYLALEVELADPGDFRTTQAIRMSWTGAIADADRTQRFGKAVR